MSTAILERYFGSITIDGVECQVTGWDGTQVADAKEEADPYGYLHYKVAGVHDCLKVRYRNPFTGKTGEVELRLYFPKKDA